MKIQSIILLLNLIILPIWSDSIAFQSVHSVSENGKFIVSREGFNNEGFIGKQRIIVKEEGNVILDTLVEIYSEPEISNRGDLAIATFNETRFYNKSFELIGKYQADESELEFKIDWGSKTFFGQYSEDGNTYYTLAYAGGKAFYILAIDKTGQEKSRLLFSESPPTDALIHENNLVAFASLKTDTEVYVVDPAGKVLESYTIPVLTHSSFNGGIDKSNGYLLYLQNNKVATTEIYTGKPGPVLTFEEAEEYLFTGSFRTLQFVLKTYQMSNYGLKSRSNLERLTDIYSSLASYPTHSYRTTQQLLDLCLYVIRLSEYNFKYPKAGLQY